MLNRSKLKKKAEPENTTNVDVMMPDVQSATPNNSVNGKMDYGLVTISCRFQKL